MTAGLNKLGAHSYEFGNFRLIPEERLLLRGDEPLALPPKVFDALVLLVENEGHLIEKNDLLDRLWEDSFVEEGTLARTISSLRKALGTDQFIETVPKRGYRFISPVRRTAAEKILSSAAPAHPQSNEFAGETAAAQNDSATVFQPEIPAPIVSPTKRRFSRPVLIIILLAVSAVSAGLIISLNWQAKPSKEIRSIAVLPFNQIGEGERDETLEFGMADTLITRLSNLKQIIVRPTSAVLKFSGQKPDAVKVGRELKVDAVLEGSIQRSGERVRVTVQLIGTADGLPLWAEKFDTRATDIFVMQDNISTRITQTLALELTGIEKQQLARRYTENTGAYQAYIKGRYLWNKRNPADFKKSLEFFEQAIEIDPNYALAYTGAADCYQLFAEYRLMPVSEGFAKARNAANKALEIDDSLAEAHASLAYTLAFYDWNWTAAEKEFKRSIELNPNYATARQWYSEYLSVVGRFDEVRIEIERAQELDPLSPAIGTDVVAYYYLTRQYDKALAQTHKVLELEPNFAWGHLFLFLIYHGKGMEAESIDAFLKVAETLYGSSQEEIRELKEAYRKAGNKGFWEKRLEQMSRPAARDIYLSWDFLGCYLQLGDYERVIEWLRKSYKNRDRWIINIKYEPSFDPVRSDPRFQELVRQIGL